MVSVLTRIHSLLLRYEDHPQGAQSEMEAIFHPSLSLFDDNLGFGEEQRPLYKITQLCCYDKEGHVVRIDTGLIEKNKEIYFSGYLKHITCEEPSIEGGVPVFDCLVGSWWSHGK